MPYVQSGDARIHYREAGAGTPLLLLHGVGSSSHTWIPQLARFAPDHHVVAPDMRGYAGSDGGVASISMRTFAVDVAAIIEHLGQGAAHLCGLSMGGIVAMTLWRDRPELVRSLALADTWAHHPAAAAGQAERLVAIDAAEMPTLARQRMPAIYGPAASADLVEIGVHKFASLNRAAYRAASADLWTQDLRDVAPTITVPTLIMVGEHDSLTPLPLSEELFRLIPGSRLSVIPDAGHLSNEENPPAFNEALAQHLAGADTDAG